MYVLIDVDMSNHFKDYQEQIQTVKPWNSKYDFPSFANKAVRVATRIPAKNGREFVQGNTIRFDFPAQGFVNPSETTIVFDLTLSIKNYDDASTDFSVFMQNNIATIFTRARLLYGSTHLEDIGNCGFLIRQLTEWTSNCSKVLTQASVAQGICKTTPMTRFEASGPVTKHARKELHSITKYTTPTTDLLQLPFTGIQLFPSGTRVPLTATRRYAITIPFGLFQQGKLLPTKFMASQLAIELSLATNSEVIMVHRNTATQPTAPLVGVPLIGSPEYRLTNVALNVESLEFDATYDAMFLDGIQSSGVPFQFATWNNYSYQLASNVAIQERARSVKAIFTMIRYQDLAYENDSHVSIGHLEGAFFVPLGAIQSYQYRIGGRYFPASPVIISSEENIGFRNGGCEAYIELEKCLNIIGDARLSTSVNALDWCRTPCESITPVPVGVMPRPLCSDGLYEFSLYGDSLGRHFSNIVPNSAAGTFDSVFCMPTCLETTNGRELSGLNAEEQSDINFMLKFSGTVTGYNYEIYTYVDNVMILRSNNVVEILK